MYFFHIYIFYDFSFDGNRYSAFVATSFYPSLLSLRVIQTKSVENICIGLYMERPWMVTQFLMLMRANSKIAIWCLSVYNQLHSLCKYVNTASHQRLPVFINYSATASDANPNPSDIIRSSCE